MPRGVSSEFWEIILGGHGSLYGGDPRIENGLQTNKQNIF